MLNKDKTLPLLLAVLLALFGCGLVRLFHLRFEAGDVYPPYSSLRFDPLGTGALFQSLQNLRGLTVQRRFQAFNQLPEGRNSTLFVLGADVTQFSDSTEVECQQLERFLLEGGRMVISFAPLNTRPRAARREDREQRAKDQSFDRDSKKSEQPGRHNSGKKGQPVNEGDDGPGAKRLSLKERWTVDFGFQDLPKDADGVFQVVTALKTAGRNGPASIRWHTALYFERPGTNWNVIYARDRRPVLIERPFGRGALVLSADSYFLSNEAMRKERHPELLAWLVGPHATVLFDESHLGELEAPGVAALVRKYRLGGVVIGLVVLAGLFVWKNALSFVPPYPEEPTDASTGAVVGKESAVGLVNLLRRSIAPPQLLSVCFAEWNKSRARGRAGLDAKTEQAAAVLAEEQRRPARERDAVKSYRNVSRVLSEGSRFKVPASASTSSEE